MPSEAEEFEFRLRMEHEMQAQQEAPKRRTPIQMGSTGPQVTPAVEAALAVGSRAASGIMGMGAGVTGMLLPGERGQGQRYMERVQDEFSYQPRSEAGQAATDVLTYLPRKLSEFGQWAGQGVARGTDIPAAGAITEQTVNFLPALLGGAALNKFGAKPEPARAEPGIRGAPQSLDMLGRTEPRIDAPTPITPARGRLKVEMPPAPPTQETMSLDRVGRGEKLPVPVRLTQGQATRDPAQLRAEENLAQTEPGQAIRDRHVEQNQAILQNLDILQDRAGPKSMTLEDVGRRVAGEKEKGVTQVTEGALSMAERKSNQNVSQLYERAKASPEGQMPVNPKPVIDWLTENGAAAASVPAINSMAQMLKKFGAVTFDEQGNAVARRNLTINEMEEIRKLAVRLDEPGKPAGHYMRELKRTIDQANQDAGGDLYKSARAARTQHALKYEEPKAIAKLLDEKSRTDRTVALEDVWGSTVLRGSISDLERVRGTLLNQTERTTRDAGRKAWRDIAGATVDYIKGEATKSVALDSSGNMNVSPAALKRAVDRIGDKKLDLILGKSSADLLRNIVQVTQDAKTMPPYKGGSTTVPNIMSMMDRVLNRAEHIPLVGPVTGGAVRMGRAAYKAGIAERQAQEALQPFRSKTAPKQDYRQGMAVKLSEIGKASPYAFTVTPSLGLRRPEE